MTFLKRALKFLKNYLAKRPLFTIVYGFAYWMDDFSFKKIKFHNNLTITDEIKKGKSMIRLGDGEIYIMNGGNLTPQKYERSLDIGMMETIKNYDDNCKYVLGINQRVMDKSNQHLKKVNQFFLWLPMKVYFFLYFNKNATYFDASVFYNKDAFEEILGAYLKTKKVVLVLSKSNMERMRGELDKKINIIEWYGTVERDCYTDYSNIKNLLDKYKNNKDTVVLLACGPTSKILVYEYCNYVQCLDVGYGIEIFFEAKGREHYLKI